MKHKFELTVAEINPRRSWCVTIISVRTNRMFQFWNCWIWPLASLRF